MKSESSDQSLSQAKRMRQFLGKGESLVALPLSLVWIAKSPQGPGHIDQTSHHRVLARARGVEITLLRIVEGKGLL
jgi:hypothetical protein